MRLLKLISQHRQELERDVTVPSRLVIRVSSAHMNDVSISDTTEKFHVADATVGDPEED